MRATSREDSGELGTTAPGWARGDRIQAEHHGIHDHRELHLMLAWNVCSDSRLQTSWKSEKSHETTVLIIDFIGFIHMPCSVTSYERWEKSKSQSPTSRGTEGTKNVFFFSLNNTVHVAFYWILYSFIGLLAYISK